MCSWLIGLWDYNTYHNIIHPHNAPQEAGASQLPNWDLFSCLNHANQGHDDLIDESFANKWLDTFLWLGGITCWFIQRATDSCWFCCDSVSSTNCFLVTPQSWNFLTRISKQLNLIIDHRDCWGFWSGPDQKMLSCWRWTWWTGCRWMCIPNKLAQDVQKY